MSDIFRTDRQKVIYKKNHLQMSYLIVTNNIAGKNILVICKFSKQTLLKKAKVPQ